MIYRVVTYEKATERIKGNLRIPPSVLVEVKRPAEFQPDHGFKRTSLRLFISKRQQHYPDARHSDIDY